MIGVYAFCVWRSSSKGLFSVEYSEGQLQWKKIRDQWFKFNMGLETLALVGMYH